MGGLGWVLVLASWVGLGWVKKNGPMSISASRLSHRALYRAPARSNVLSTPGRTDTEKSLIRSQPPFQKSFIRYDSNAGWTRTITTKYKYRLDNKNIKNTVITVIYFFI